MYETNKDFPSKKDLELISKVGDKGKYLIEDLNKIFSFKKPREYKLYIEKLNYIPTDDEKVIIDLILIIQKYNEALADKMANYKNKNEENKYFSLLYKGMKVFNSEFCGKEANSVTNLYGNLITQYKKKHISFDTKFLSRNIFNKCGLLPYTKKQTLSFFDSEIQSNGPNSYKSIKAIKFIEKLYEQIEKMLQRVSFTSNKNGEKVKSQKSIKREKKMELMDKINKCKLQIKEINNDKVEIKKIKELIDIANIHYYKILKELNIKYSKNKKKKVKIKNKEKININNQENSKNEENNNNNNNTGTYEHLELTSKFENENKKNYININEMIDNEKKKTFYKKNMNVLDKYNRTSSVERFNGLNLFGVKTTSSTGFIDFSKNISKNNTFYNSNKIILNNLNNFNLTNRSTKVILPPTNPKRIFRNISNLNNRKNIININSMNKTTKNIFQINKVNFKNTENNTNIKTNIQFNNTINNNFLSPNNSSPNIFDKKDEKDETKNDKLSIPKRSKKRKKTNIRKNNLSPKKNKLELYLMRKKKIPDIYEELKNYKNLLSISKKNKNNSQRMRVEHLFSQLYDKNKIQNLNKQTAPIELYNSYYNMKESIEKCHGPDIIYRKFKNNMHESLRHKIGRSIDQDDELKNKYYDFMQMIIKKKIEDEENDL